MRFSLLTLLLTLTLGCAHQPVQTLRIDGSNGVRPLITDLAEAYQAQYPNRKVLVGTGMSSRDRLPALDADSIQLIMASHGLDIPRLEMDGYEVIRFAQMPVVIATHHDVSIDSIDGLDLCAIYAGKLTNWQALNGPDQRIIPFIRPEDEVDSEVLLENIPCMRVIALDTSVQIRESSGDMARALAQTPFSIGVTTLTRIAQSEGKIKALAFNGTNPTVDDMASGRYNLLRDAFLVHGPDAPETVVHFLTFVKSKRGQKIIRENGALPVIGN